jgi:integrase
MGRTFEMSWEGHPNYRWVKYYKGNRYRVSCKTLGLPESKQDSYQGANRWWRVKKAEIDTPVLEEEHERALRDIDRKIRHAGTHLPEVLPELRKARAEILASDPWSIGFHNEAEIAKNLATAKLFGIEVADSVPPEVIQQFFGDRQIWAERFSRSGEIERSKTLGVCLEEFLAELRLKQMPATYSEIDRYLRRLTDSSGVWTQHTDVTRISEQTVVDHYRWLKSLGYDAGAHNKRLGFFRRFVSWLWMLKKLENKPRNLEDDSHRESVSSKPIKKYYDVAGVLKSLPTEQHLWALLGLNCGMTATDLGSLEWGQIDRKLWTLTRRRVKTGKRKSVPTVTYKLWPETIALLTSRSAGDGDSLVFVTANGGQMYASRFSDEGKAKIKDNFGLRWKRLKPKPSVPLSKFRGIACTILKKSAIHRQYADYFLGHAPRSMEEKHYGEEADAPFFEALAFIREDLFPAAVNPVKVAGRKPVKTTAKNTRVEKA